MRHALAPFVFAAPLWLWACQPSLHTDLSQSTVHVQQSSGSSYAAMEEIPVTGGELRLIEPIEIVVEAEAESSGPQAEEPERRHAIGFPLEQTDVDVDVDGMMAVYSVEQTFENPFETPIEAVYMFPLGDEASVIDYQIAIGERTIQGEIRTRQQAREVYREAKESGHTAALLEQEKPNVFSQRIANIAPKESVRVRFQYVEMLEHREQSYELVFPMVVGPRYLPEGDVGRRPVGSHRAGTSGRAGVASIPYVDKARAGHSVTFRAEIDAGVPIDSVRSPTHDLDVARPAATRRTVTLPEHERIPNRDLVLRYDTAGQKTVVGLLTHRLGEDDGYFSLIVQPKERYRTGDIAPREVILLIDASGSMSGAPTAQSKALARAILNTLRPRDSFNVISFASRTELMRPAPIAGDERGKRAGEAFLGRLQAGGGTEMEAGVLRSLTRPAGGDRLRTIYLLSDGFVGNDEVILGAARRALGGNRIYPVGIGSAPNRHLMDRLAEVGRGFSSYLTPAEAPDEIATDLVRRSAYPYLTNVKIDWGDLAVDDVMPEVIPDVHAGVPLVLTGRYREPGRGRVQVVATTAGRRISIPLDVVLPARSSRPGVGYVWAGERIRALMGKEREVSREVKDEVTELGLAFHMVTDFTSFVAVDRSRVVSAPGGTRTVAQPAIVPEGVSRESAAGGGAAPAARSRRSGGGGGDWSGGGGGWGGGDVDPFTLFILLLLLPAVWAIRRARTA